MKLLLRIALRNVFAHKLKTLIVGGLIFLGIFLIVLGNSFLDSTSRGIQNAYTKSITGQIAVLKRIDFDYSLFGTWTDVGNLSVPAVPDYGNTMKYLEGLENITSVAPVSSSFGVVNLNDTDDGPWMITLGISPESYVRMFDISDTLIMHEGRFLQGDEEGIVLSSYLADYLKDYKNLEVHAGDKILLNGYSTNGFRIREVTVRGIFEFRYVSGDMYPMLPRTCYLDAGTFAVLNGMTVSASGGESAEALLPDDLALSLSSGSFDGMFEDTVETGTGISAPVETDLDLILGDPADRAAVSVPAADAWQWILIGTDKTDNDSVKKQVKLLDEHFRQEFSRIDPENILRPGLIAGTLISGRKPSFSHLYSLFSDEQKAVLAKIENEEIPTEQAGDV